eukprot:134212_1
MTDAVARIINHVYSQDLLPLQPSHNDSYAAAWKEFDQLLFEIAWSLLTDMCKELLKRATSLQMMFDITKLFICNSMHKIAIHNRHEGRYDDASNLYNHILDFMKVKNITTNEFPLHISNIYLSMCIVYLHYPSMNERKRAQMTIKYCLKSLECVKIAKRLKNENINKYKYQFKMRNDCFDEIIIEGGAYHHMANANKYLNNDKQRNIYFEKAFQIFSNINDKNCASTAAKMQVHYFMYDYLKWIMVKYPLKKKQLIQKLLKSNTNFSMKHFGELSVELADNYQTMADYQMYLLQKFKNAVKNYNISLDISLKVFNGFMLNNKAFIACNLVQDTIIPVYNSLGIISERFSDFCKAKHCYQSGMKFVRFLFKQKIKTIELIEREKEFKLGLKRINNKNNNDEVHPMDCKICKQCTKAIYEPLIKHGSKKYRKKIGQKQEKSECNLVLKNIAKYKWCKYCKDKNRKLFLCNGCKKVYYCSHNHQKRDWKQHKISCGIKRTEEESEDRSFVEMLNQLNFPNVNPF